MKAIDLTNELSRWGAKVLPPTAEEMVGMDGGNSVFALCFADPWALENRFAYRWRRMVRFIASSRKLPVPDFGNAWELPYNDRIQKSQQPIADYFRASGVNATRLSLWRTKPNRNYVDGCVRLKQYAPDLNSGDFDLGLILTDVSDIWNSLTSLVGEISRNMQMEYNFMHTGSEVTLFYRPKSYIVADGKEVHKHVKCEGLAWMKDDQGVIEEWINKPELKSMVMDYVLEQFNMD